MCWGLRVSFFCFGIPSSLILRKHGGGGMRVEPANIYPGENAAGNFGDIAYAGAMCLACLLIQSPEKPS